MILISLTFPNRDAIVEGKSTTKNIEKSTLDESTQTDEPKMSTEEHSTGEIGKGNDSLGQSTELPKVQEEDGVHLEEVPDTNHEDEVVNNEVSNDQQMFESNEIPKPKYPTSKEDKDSLVKDEKHEENDKNEGNEDVKNEENKEEENDEENKEKSKEEKDNDGKENIEKQYNEEEEIQDHFNDFIIMESKEDYKEEKKEEEEDKDDIVNETKGNDAEVKNVDEDKIIKEEDKNEERGNEEEKKKEEVKIEENLPKVNNQTIIANDTAKGEEHKSDKKDVGFWQRITCLLIRFNCPPKNEKKDKNVEEEVSKPLGVSSQPQSDFVNVNQKNTTSEVDELGSLEKEHNLSVENLGKFWNDKYSLVEGMQHFNATMKFGATFIRSEIDESGKQHSNITKFNAEIHN